MTNIFDEHPAKRVNGTPMLLALNDKIGGDRIYAGTARPKKVARHRRRNALARLSRRANRG